MQEHFQHILLLNKALDDWHNDQVHQHFGFLLQNLANLHEQGYFVSNLFESLDLDDKGLLLKASFQSQEISYKEEGGLHHISKQHLAAFQIPEELQNSLDGSRNVYEIGLLLLAFTCKIDFFNKNDFNLFLDFQDNLQALNPALHPGIASLIQEMLHLNSKLSLKDLNEAVYRLKNYKLYQELSLKNDILRETELLPFLKQRLFDLSRRNRMLYFKASKKLLNLSLLSLIKDASLANEKAASFLNWNKHLQKLVSKEQSLKLEAFFEDSLNFPIHLALNKLRLEANKDIREFGFSQLKLAIVFLHWNKTENGLKEEISSPLILLPVSIIKKKGLESKFELHFEDSLAEVNPVLRYQFKELYGIQMPEKIDLEIEDPYDFYLQLSTEIKAKTTSLNLQLTHNIAKISLYEKALSYAKNLFNKEALKSTLIFKYETIENYLQTLCSPLNFKAELAPSSKNTWELDLNHLVLGNFNYKRMSLVKDFEEIEEKNIISPLFKEFFSKESPNRTKESQKTTFQELYNVLPSDPSQDESIQQANTGNSYLIQGPPGTGKSQTISNLIANLLAQDKKVLFICEKRAAIDVVFERLQEIGLSSHCSLIHDSQVDKKSFIADLKTNYETLQEQDIDIHLVEKEREKILFQIENELGGLKIFQELMLNYASAEQKDKIRHLYDEMIALRYALPPSYSLEKATIPPYQLWERHKNALKELFEAMEKQGLHEGFQSNPVSLYTQETIQAQLPLRELQERLREIQEHAFIALTAQTRLNKTPKHNLEQEFAEVQELKALSYYSDNKLLNLLDSKTQEWRNFEDEFKLLQNLKRQVEKAEAKNKNWKQKFSRQDTQSALALCQRFEGRFLGLFNGAYKKLKKTLAKSYNFEAHQIAPSYTEIFLFLKEEYDLRDEIENLHAIIAEKYPNKPLDLLRKELLDWHKNEYKSSWLWIKENSANEDLYNYLKTWIESFEKLQKAAGIIDWQFCNSLDDLQEKIILLQDNISSYSFYLPYLNQLYQADSNFIKFLKGKNWNYKELQAAFTKSRLELYLLENKNFEHLNGDTLDYHCKKLEEAISSLLKCNSILLQAKRKKKLQSILRRSSISTVGLNEEQKEEKAKWNEARRILENEFNKSMRYKSIRELASLESGNLVRELKPVWLMSPLSVSDTLPINSKFFDVVIYDEASQINLEDGVLPLFRAKQCIVVGDKMQMPPNKLFQKQQEDIDEFEDEYDFLASESLLDQGARTLNSFMLNWHYRSKHESLINFSNAAFYENKLVSIPDRLDRSKLRTDISSKGSFEAAYHYTEILKRPISYHYIENGIYEKRSNLEEAAYVAELVKHLLLSQNQYSIGVVAFSQEQQNAIELALEKLTFFDKSFEDIEEEAAKKDPNYQEVFVKNLENVQGNERDIIIISTAYGYNNEGKMRMNFGPINRKGGEKRLNVLFTRAKQRMVVVSSIKENDIKNTYNEGSNYLKKYLNYAESISLGKTDKAEKILQSLQEKNLASNIATSNFLEELNKEVLLLGYTSQINLGLSSFKCQLAIKKNKHQEYYDLALLIDDEAHYEEGNLYQNYLLKPQILKQFSWKVMSINSKDWYERKDQVLRRIKEALETDVDANVETMNKALLLDRFIKKNEEINFIRLEKQDDEQMLFWEIGLQENDLIIRYGKKDSEGQRLIKSYSSMGEAINTRRKLMDQKIKSGYQRV